MMSEFEGERRIVYGEKDDEDGQLVFVPRCEKCMRFAKPDATVKGPDGPNATCTKCGRTNMLFEGYM